MFAHAILRYLLGSYFGSRPEELDFATNEYGKPLIKAPGGNEIPFSLSHSQDMALVNVQRPLHNLPKNVISDLGLELGSPRNYSGAEISVNHIIN